MNNDHVGSIVIMPSMRKWHVSFSISMAAAKNRKQRNMVAYQHLAASLKWASIRHQLCHQPSVIHGGGKYGLRIASV